VATAAEQGDHVVDVAPRGTEVHQEGWLAGHPEAAGGDEGGLHAMGLAVAECCGDRSARRPGGFVVPLKPIDEVLNPGRRPQAGERGGDAARESEANAEGCAELADRAGGTTLAGA
jgi:hypothetical protein